MPNPFGKGVLQLASLFLMYSESCRDFSVVLASAAFAESSKTERELSLKHPMARGQMWIAGCSHLKTPFMREISL